MLCPSGLSPAGHRLDNSIVPHQNALQSRRVLLKRERQRQHLHAAKGGQVVLKNVPVRGALCKDQNFCQTEASCVVALRSMILPFLPQQKRTPRALSPCALSNDPQK